MNKIFALFQLMRKNGTAPSYTINTKNKFTTAIRNFTSMKFFSVIFYVLSFLAALLLYFSTMGDFNEESFFEIFMMLSLFGFFFQLMFSISIGFYVYYLNNDLEQYLVLPITKNQLLLTRLAYTIYYSYYFTLVTVVPLLILHIVKFGPSIYNILGLTIGSLLSITTSTILPIVIIFLFVSVFKFLRNKNSITYLFYILIIILSFGYNFAGQKLFQSLAKNAIDANYHITDFIVNGGFIVKTLNNHSIVPILVLILTAVLATGLYLVFGNLFYIKNATRLSESASKKQAINYDKIKVKKESMLMTLVIREFKGIIRSPHKVIQFLLMPILLILIVIGGSIYGLISSGESIDQLISTINLGIAFLPNLSKELLGSDHSLLLVALIGILLAGFQLFSSANASAISIEGDLGFSVIKTWPIKFSKILHAKVLISPIINFLTYVLFIIFGLIVIKNKIYILVPVGSFLIANYLVGWYCLTVNVLFPKFQWSNEMQVVKNSASAVISSMTILPYAFIVYQAFLTNNILLIALAVSSVAILGFIGMCYCLIFSEKIFKKLNNK